MSSHNDFGLVNDMFAVGGVGPVRYYHSLYDRVAAYGGKVLCNPERLLAHHVDCRPGAYRLTTAPIVILVFRPHMAGLSIEECLRQHPGSSKWKDPEVLAAHQEFHRRRRGEAGARHVDEFAQSHLKVLGGAAGNGGG
jgi:hypothetical protein